jgi:hypothetical protein
MNGISSLKSASRTSLTDRALRWWEALLLIGSGVTALVLHRAFDLFTWSRNGSCFPLWSSVSTIQPF